MRGAGQPQTESAGERAKGVEMRIESQRLVCCPVSDGEMERLIENEKDAGLKQAYSEMLRGCLAEPENRIWHAVWAMELKERPGTVVGDFSFKGAPQDGMVEIGYGLREEYRGYGYMTETLKAASVWALGQKGVTRVEAETEPENEASQKTLLRAGFVPTGAVGKEGPRFVFRRRSHRGGKKSGIVLRRKFKKVKYSCR